MRVDDQLAQQYKCQKCDSAGAQAKRIAATGTGLSKMFDIQNNQFIALSCQNCGYTEFYNPDILEKSNGLSNIIDALFD